MNPVLAYADNGSPAGGLGVIGSLIPLLIMGSLFGIFSMKIAKVKGRNPLLSFLAMFVPLFNVFYMLWLVSLPHKSVIDQLTLLTKDIDRLKRQTHSEDMRDIWTCSCGKVNKMEITNCPECGLKRDFILKKNTSIGSH